MITKLPVAPARMTPKPPPIQWRTRLQALVGQTHTRILLLYAVTLLTVIAAAIPIFRYFLFAAIDDRVYEDLAEEHEDFEADYAAWNRTAPDTRPALEDFISNFLKAQVPEDDNFHLFFLDGQLYRSNPTALPPSLEPGSAFNQHLVSLDVATETTDRVPAPIADGGDRLYKTYPLQLGGQAEGLFVVVHLTAGERAEALVGVTLFARIAIAVVGIAFLCAWLGSRQLLKPVGQLAKTAQVINEKNLSQRLPVTGTGELADLAVAFNTMMDRVQTAFDTQRSFINDASHELRTPLTIIQGHLELMGDDPQEQADTLALVMDELSRMGRFVQDLLLLAKADRPDFLRLETVHIPTLIDAVFAKVTALGDRQWLKISPPDVKWVVDSQQLTGALVNLANNAVQHTQPGDVIELGGALTEGHLRLWVRDTGAGIAATDQTRIFDRFARAAHTYRRSEGAGLGLAIVKTIAETHGGSVTLHSQVGIGSTFSLILPPGGTPAEPQP